MKPDFDECLKSKKLIRVETEREIASQELKEGESDLGAAKNDFGLKDWKWSTTKAYYAMFHAARALLYLKGFKERKSHACLIEGIRELYVKEGKFSLRFVEYLEAGKARREDATYELTYSEEVAATYIQAAEEFISKAKESFTD
ncbi:MAG: HEPN domain-containing protein [Nanoarchaeota archaeon]